MNELSTSTTDYVAVTQDDFYNYNNNFVTFGSFVALAFGVVVGVLLGRFFHGIFKD